MRIDFIADAACVWSFITWRQLRAAMRDFAADFDIAVFFPRAQSAVPRSKLNPADRARMLAETARPLLAQAGCDVDFDALPRLPDDLSPLYRMMQGAFSCRKGCAVLDAVFSSFFERGENIGDASVIDRIARENGVPAGLQPDHRSAPRPDRTADEILQAVPCLIFDRRTIIFGAQTDVCLKNMIALALNLEKEPDFQQI